jgi:hypothetical protein
VGDKNSSACCPTALLSLTIAVVTEPTRSVSPWYLCLITEALSGFPLDGDPCSGLEGACERHPGTGASPGRLGSLQEGWLVVSLHTAAAAELPAVFHSWIYLNDNQWYFVLPHASLAWK